MLEDHGDFVASQLAQLGFGHLRQRSAVDLESASGGGQEPVDHADERGLAAAGQAHDDENLAGFYVERGVDDGSCTAFFH